MEIIYKPNTFFLNNYLLTIWKRLKWPSIEIAFEW